MRHCFSILMLFLLISCGSKEAQPIKVNVDNCDFCGMSIADGKYAAEVITEKGRAYKFDDILCMMNYCKENSNTKMGAYFVSDFTQDNTLISAETAFFLSGGTIQSPMRGGIIALSNQADASAFAIKLEAEPITWKAILAK
jgi:copper chaperone NosL